METRDLCASETLTSAFHPLRTLSGQLLPIERRD
jgi:hypothetical protein